MGVGAGVNAYLEKIDRAGETLVQAGHRADGHADHICELLEAIKENTENLYGVNVYEYPRLPFSAGGSKEVTGREGFIKIIKQVAVVAAAAVDVDLFVADPGDGGFLQRVSLAAAGRTSITPNLPVPEAAPIFVVTSAAAQVNLVLERKSL